MQARADEYTSKSSHLFAEEEVSFPTARGVERLLLVEHETDALEPEGVAAAEHRLGVVRVVDVFEHDNALLPLCGDLAVALHSLRRPHRRSVGRECAPDPA